MARKYIAIPYAYLEECELLTDAEFGQLMRALLRYSRSGEVIDLTGNAAFYAKRMMLQEDVFRERYEATSRRRSEAGKQGMASRWGQKPGAEQPG